jgi:hypothetical protein
MPGPSYWNLSRSFAGFTVTQSTSQTVALSTTVNTIVDINTEPPNTGNSSNIDQDKMTLAISGSFLVNDVPSYTQSNIGCYIARNESNAVHPSRWYFRLVFPPQPTAVSVQVQCFGMFAVFAAGTM